MKNKRFFSKDPTTLIIVFGAIGILVGIVGSLVLHYLFYLNLGEIEHKSIFTLKVLLFLIPSTAISLLLLFIFFLLAIVKKHTNTLFSTNKLLENIFDSIPQRIFWKNSNGEYLGGNRLFLQDLGLKTPNELLGKTNKELNFEPKELKKFEKEDIAILKKGWELKKIRNKRVIDGETYSFEGSKLPLKDKKGEVIGIVGVYEDITKNLIQEALVVRQGRLAQMGEMLSMIAHQWRQPLNVISAINSAIRLKTFKDKIDKEYLLEKLNETNEQVKYLSNTIEDFRSFFKPNIEKKEVLTKDIIEDTLKIIKSSIDSRAIDIVLNIETDMSLFTYKNRVIQVLLTIIKNAKEAIEQKNIENGKIIISTKKENERLTIEVCDNGTGIEDKKLEKIFLPYFTTKHESVGTGIGLYMSKVIIEEHCGGKLTAHNNSDGVCFKITL